MRKILDEAGLSYVKIVASNDLNEYKIHDLKSRGAVIDVFGVGTEMIVAKPVAAISGVYKLVEDGDGAKIKLSPGKKTYPGRKQVFRVLDRDGFFSHDILALDGEIVDGFPLLEKVVSGGKRVRERRSLDEIRSFCLEQVSRMPPYLKNVKVQQEYSVKISPGLNRLVNELVKKYGVKEKCTNLM